MGLARSIFILFLVTSLGACVGASHRPAEPDESLLRPAQVLLKKADAAGASELAADTLREAYRRLNTARGLLYNAAVQGRSVNKREKQRIMRLVEEASVDARLALAQTQQEAVQRKLNEYQASVQGDKESK